MFLSPIFGAMKIKELSVPERPREKLLACGAQTLSTGELLAILLRTGTRGKNVLDTAQELLALAGGTISGLFSLSRSRMCTVPGIKSDKVATLQAAMEIGRRFLGEKPLVERRPIVSPRMVYDEMLPRLKAVAHEECWALFLNNAHYRTGRERLSLGNLNSASVDVRALVKSALEKNAAAIVLVHNHPGTNPRPSAADIKTTQRLRQALSTFDISLLDHVIVSDDSFYSFADEQVYTA